MVEAELGDTEAWKGMDQEVRERSIEYGTFFNSYANENAIEVLAINMEGVTLKGKEITMENPMKASESITWIDNKSLGQIFSK